MFQVTSIGSAALVPAYAGYMGLGSWKKCMPKISVFPVWGGVSDFKILAATPPKHTQEWAKNAIKKILKICLA